MSCDAGGTRAIIKSITIALVFPPEVRYEEEDVAIRATRLAMTSPAERIPMLPQYDNRTSTVGKKLIQKEKKYAQFRTDIAPNGRRISCIISPDNTVDERGKAQ